MEAVLRAVFIYFFLWLILRIAGKRTLAEITMFDFVLLLVISGAAQPGLVGEDYSMTNSAVIIATLVLVDIIFSLLKVRFTWVDDVLDGRPVIIVDNGRLLKDRMRKLRVNEDDVLEAARRLQGLEEMSQIKYAVMEINGGITVIPREQKIRS